MALVGALDEAIGSGGAPVRLHLDTVQRSHAAMAWASFAANAAIDDATYGRITRRLIEGDG